MESLLAGTNAVIAVMVVLGLCLYCHELGHFLAAKASRMAVHEFALGFGPALWRRKIGETLYAIRLVPFGGFVRIAGMEPGERDARDGFFTRPKWQGLIVLCAGVFMNVVLAVALYWSINVFSGVAAEGNDVIIRKVFPGEPAGIAGVQPDDKIIGVGGSLHSTEIVSVTKGSLGERIGLKPDTRLLQVGDTPVAVPADVLRALQKGPAKDEKIWLVDSTATSFEESIVSVEAPAAGELASVPKSFGPEQGDELAGNVLGVRFAPADQFAVHRFISGNPDRQIRLTVLREGRQVALSITPASSTQRLEMVNGEGKLINPHRSVGRIGITLGPELRRTGALAGLKLAVAQSTQAVVMVFETFRLMILGRIAAEPTGPIGIMAMTAETAKLGWASVLGLCALISANLAVINLLPIPPFDGGQILLMGVEAIYGIFGRPLNRRLEMFVRVAGLVIVLNLFLLMAYKDIANLIKYGTY